MMRRLWGSLAVALVVGVGGRVQLNALFSDGAVLQTNLAPSSDRPTSISTTRAALCAERDALRGP